VRRFWQIQYVRYESGHRSLLFGSRTITGWSMYLRYRAAQKFFGVIHGLFPKKHQWELRYQDFCVRECCGDTEMRCYKCGTNVSLEDALLEMARRDLDRKREYFWETEE
jgi:hypothetical protein